MRLKQSVSLDRGDCSTMSTQTKVSCCIPEIYKILICQSYCNKAGKKEKKSKLSCWCGYLVAKIAMRCY